MFHKPTTLPTLLNHHRPEPKPLAPEIKQHQGQSQAYAPARILPEQVPEGRRLLITQNPDRVAIGNQPPQQVGIVPTTDIGVSPEATIRHERHPPCSVLKLGHACSPAVTHYRSEEHTSELQSRENLV